MVFRKRRVETQEAEQLRSRRQHFAAPGGSHDRMVRFLARVLPMGVGVLAALMLITPLSPRGEVSFLLDRNEVAVIKERMKVDNALYRGQDARGRPFSITAGEAVQRSSAEGIVRMEDLVAGLLMEDGPARVSAPSGQYNIAAETMAFGGLMQVKTANGYWMKASGVLLSLKDQTVVGSKGVQGEVAAGTFRANRMEANLPERTVTLTGNAHLRMVPGKLRMP